MYCLKPQQSRLSVKTAPGNYSFQQNNSCRVAISFGWTSEQLFKGKSVTRRRWKDSYAQQFIDRWQRGINTYIALDKSRRWGGKQIGWITLTCCPYKERLKDMPQSDQAAEGFPELNQQEFIQRFFKGNDQQQVWVIRFRFTPLIEESCSTRISGKLDTEGDVEDSCSTRISKLVEENCSTRISQNASEARVSPTNELQPQFRVGVSDRLPLGTRVHHRKDPDRAGTILSAVHGSTRYHVLWDVGGKSAVEGRNLSLIRVERQDYRRLLIADPDYLLEDNGQLTIFSDDEPPDPDDFNSLDEFEQAWKLWELQYPKLAEAVRQAGRAIQTIRVEQKSHIRVEQPSQIETVKTPKTRNTKPGRGSRPKQVACNVKRNSSKGKSANTYWVYKFSFKVDGKYYNRSCSIPKEKVNRVIEMWESKQYSWINIVELIGKNPDKIIDKARGKK